MTLPDEDKKLAEECGVYTAVEYGCDWEVTEIQLALLLHKVREAEREKCAVHCKNSDRYRGEYFAEEIRNLK